MKQFFAVFLFELTNYTKSKPFIILMTVFIVGIAGVLTFPRIKPLFVKDTIEITVGGHQDSTNASNEAIAVIDYTGSDTIEELFTQALQGYKMDYIEMTYDEAAQRVENDDYKYVIILDDALSYRLLTKNMNIYDSMTYMLDEIMITDYRLNAIMDKGFSEEQIEGILYPHIQNEVIELGTSGAESFFYTYISLMLLYMCVIIFGQLVSTSVASEKSSRAMEVLVTTVDPVKMMFGKIIGAGTAGLVQIVGLLGSSVLFYNINKSYWQENDIVASIFNMPLDIFLYSVLFFILGYFLYAFMYGAMGSLASRTEDINSSTMPITFLLLIAFLLVMFSLAEGNVDSMMMRVLSFVPFTSPFAMLVRVSMNQVNTLEVILSILILMATTVGIGYLSAAIYRMGVLMYGKPPKIKEIYKLMKS